MTFSVYSNEAGSCHSKASWGEPDAKEWAEE